jgi:hypothetical protein
MGTSAEIDWALEILKGQGRTVGAASHDANGELRIAIDGQYLSFPEIYEMVERPEEVCAFDAHGKQYAVLIWFIAGGQTCELYEDGKKVRDRRPIPIDQDWFGFSQQLCKDLGGDSFRRC